MIVVATIFLVTIIYLYIKWIHSYWKRVGLEYIKPDLIYGIVKSMMVGNESIGDFYKNCYEEFKSKGLKHGGIYELFTPTYVPTDLEIIKCVLQKDFSHFMNHLEYVNEERDPLTGHLLSLENEKWKKLRAKLTPTFTSGKMKMMFPTIVSCTAGLEELLKEYARIQDPVFIKDILSRFTTDIIGSAAFGIDCNSLKNPKSEFREFGNKIFKNTAWRRVKRLISNTLPRSFLHYIGFKRNDREIEDFFMGVVRSTVNYREKNNIYRKDFMHLLLQLKNKGKVTDDEDITPVEHKSPDGHFLTFNEVAAQCFIFFLAGFETSGTTMTFALLELAQNPDVQEKLRTDIKRVLKKYDNQITYEAIMEMTYLEKVVNETLRKHPPVSVTDRVCNEDYVVPGTDILIKRGVRLRIPILGLHRDPEYYPEPERFDPERFNEENTASRPSCAFMPFGEGPRACIGARFGLLQSKVGLVSVINNFEVTLNQKTKLPITYVLQSPLLDVVGDVWLNINTLE